MKDRFGRPLMRLFQDKNTNTLVAAWTKAEAIEFLLTNTNLYSNIDNVNLVSIRNCGYAGVNPKIL